MCTWHPRSAGSCSNAFFAFSLVTAASERAINTSSVWSLGFFPPRKRTFRSWIGSIASGRMSFSSCSMPARYFNAFRSNAADAPRKSDVLDVMIQPSESSIAAVGTPSSSARFFAATVTCLSSVVILACFIRSSIL